METTSILLTAIRLLFHEKAIEDTNVSNSADTVRNLLKIISENNKSFNSKKQEIAENLSNYLYEMIENFPTYVFDAKIIKQELSLLTESPDIIEDLVDDILEDMSVEDRQSAILRYRAIIKSYIQKITLKIISRKFSSDMSKRKAIGNVDEYVDNLKDKLESIRSGFTSEDPAIKNKFTLDASSLRERIETIKDEVNNGLLLKTKFSRLNKVLDGGFRRGELVTVTARDHGYKSGFSRSVFLQLLGNEPVVMNKEKKPLLILLSLEDTDRQIIKFIFEYFKSSDGENTKLTDVSIDEAIDYVVGKLQENPGWTIEILNVDPSNWGYKDVFNLIEEYESKGYEVIAILIDYLALLSKIGCKGTGVTGSETRELFRRIGNYCRAKDILCITPHQASSGLKTLSDNGVKDQDMLREIYGLGFFADTRQIGQEHDVGILLHPCIVDDNKYLNVAVDKHRGFVINYAKAFWYYKFPKHNMPIPHDVDKDTALDKIEAGYDDIF